MLQDAKKNAIHHACWV